MVCRRAGQYTTSGEEAFARAEEEEERQEEEKAVRGFEGDVGNEERGRSSHPRNVKKATTARMREIPIGIA